VARGKVVLAVFRSRWRIIGGAAGVCLAAAVGYGVLAPELFRATTILMLDPGGAPGESIAARATHRELLRSERVAQRVVDNLHLVQDPAFGIQYLQSIDQKRPPVQFLAQYLAAHVRVSETADAGNIVQVDVLLPDPEAAARVANAYAQAWGEVSLEMRAQAIRNGVERADQELASLRARLGEARSRQDRPGAIAAVDSRADEQFAHLSRIAQGSTAPVTDVARQGTQLLGSLAQSLSAVVLSGVGQDSHEQGLLAGIAGSGPSAGGSSLPGLATSEAAPPGNGAGVPGVEYEIRRAQQSLARAEERLAMLSAESIGAPFPVHVIVAAQTPQASSKMDLGLCLSAGLLIAIFAGALAALVAERLDRRVRDASDVARGLGIVVLGDLPPGKHEGLPAQDRPAGAGATRWLRLERA